MSEVSMHFRKYIDFLLHFTLVFFLSLDPVGHMVLDYVLIYEYFINKN